MKREGGREGGREAWTEEGKEGETPIQRFQHPHPNDNCCGDLLSPMHVVDTLDEGLTWAEDLLLARLAPSIANDPITVKHLDVVSKKPPYLRQLQLICLDIDEDHGVDSINKLLSYFRRESIAAGKVLWRQGDSSDRAVLLESGTLKSTILEEEGIAEFISVGHLVGEFGLLNGSHRQGTVVAQTDCTIWILSQQNYNLMAKNEPEIALILAKICIAYFSQRVSHVSNRLVESRCIPV